MVTDGLELLSGGCFFGLVLLWDLGDFERSFTPRSGLSWRDSSEFLFSNTMNLPLGLEARYPQTSSPISPVSSAFQTPLARNRRLMNTYHMSPDEPLLL